MTSSHFMDGPASSPARSGVALNDSTAQKRPQAVPRPELASKIPRPPLTPDLRQRSLLRRPLAGALLRVPRPAQIDEHEMVASTVQDTEAVPESLLPSSAAGEAGERVTPLPGSASPAPSASALDAAQAPGPASPAPNASALDAAPSPGPAPPAPNASALDAAQESELATASEPPAAVVVQPTAGVASLADVLADLDSDRTTEFRVPEELLRQVRRQRAPGLGNEARSSGVQSKQDAQSLQQLEAGFAQQETATYRVSAVAIERALALGTANDEHRRQVRDACERDTLTPVQRREAIGEDQAKQDPALVTDGELSIPPIQPSPSQLAPPRLPLDLLAASTGAHDDDFSQELELAAVAPPMSSEVAPAASTSRLLLGVVCALSVIVAVLVVMVVRGG